MYNFLIDIQRSIGRIEGAIDDALPTIRSDIGDLKQEIRCMRRRLRTVEQRHQDKPSRAEKLIKNNLTWLLPLGTLYLTGSVEAAVKILSALK